ncbi:MAG: GatB/YqeY domain-containing protein [Acidimicrobiia bacterium]|nr:GatB/YqeY domain-containing protein [Acidimicrobiia bacterium]
MTIHEQLAANLKDAMRAKDKPQINVIRQIESEVTLEKTADGFDGEVDDDLYMKVIAAYVKKMKKAQGEFEAAGERGAEQAAKLAYEVDYLSQWLPEEVGEDETRSIVRDAMAELGVADPKEMGRVIGHIMRSHNELDGGLVNRLVREELGA